MYHNQSSPYERSTGSGRHEDWQPVTDGYDPLRSEPTRVHRAVDSEATRLHPAVDSGSAPGSGGFPTAPAQATRVFPAVGAPGGSTDRDHPGRPVSPAEPVSGGHYRADVAGGTRRADYTSGDAGYGAAEGHGGYPRGTGHVGGYSGGTGHAEYAGGTGHADYAGGTGQGGYAAGAGSVYTPGTAQVGYRSEAGAVRSSATRSRSASRNSGSVSNGPTDLRVSLGAALTAGGGLLVVLCSFGPFIRYDNVGGVQRLAGKEIPLSFSAWSGETFLAPLTWWPILASLALVALGALRLTGRSDDRELLGFRPGQLQVMLSLLSFLVLLGYAFSGKSLVFGSDLHDAVTAKFGAGDISVGWGGHLMLLGSLVAAVGAFLDHLGVGPTIWPRPARSAGYQPRRGQDRPGHGYGRPASGHQQPAGYPPHQPAPYQQRSGHYGM